MQICELKRGPKTGPLEGPKNRTSFGLLLFPQKKDISGSQKRDLHNVLKMGPQKGLKLGLIDPLKNNS